MRDETMQITIRSSVKAPLEAICSRTGLSQVDTISYMIMALYIQKSDISNVFISQGSVAYALKKGGLEAHEIRERVHNEKTGQVPPNTSTDSTDDIPL